LPHEGPIGIMSAGWFTFSHRWTTGGEAGSSAL
jgi:hypothetical protein